MWQEINNKLVKKFVFKDFNDAWKFMSVVAEMAKEIRHHPRWINEYNVVIFELYAHSENKVTDKDRELASRIDHMESMKEYLKDPLEKVREMIAEMKAKFKH